MSEMKASYTAPEAAPESFKQPLASCSAKPSTEERTAYLTSLRNSITDMQDQINVFLTKKMEEDNQKADATIAAQDAKEEENYGEEAVEED